MPQIDSNKLIVKNTIFLYIRSFLTMAISLFTSRVILQILGVSDYGLYGALGSIVAMFSILNNVLAVGTSRFLTFELGTGNKERLKKIFSASFTMHILMAAILFLLFETVGLWFVNNKLTIPYGRELAANIVYQISILTAMLSLTQVPYMACIIAHERMSVYAYVAIGEVTFKLLLILILLYIPFEDNLIAYSIILAIWSIGLQIWYRYYCYKRFEESHLELVEDKLIYKEMLSYSLWDFIGQFCATGNSQGLNILLNMFFGVTINAARSIAYQVENAVSQFTNNFLTAVNPQITKSYAQRDYNRFLRLIEESSKFSFYLLYIISLPLFLEANYVLSLWLVEVPETTVIFLRFALYYSVFRVITKPIIVGIHATGYIRYLNLTSGCYSVGTFLLFIYISYKLGAPYWACFIVQAFNGFILTFFELTSLNKNIRFNCLYMIKSIIIKPWIICLFASLPPIIIINILNESFIRLILTCIFSVASVVCFTYFWGIDKQQRDDVKIFIKTKISKR